MSDTNICIINAQNGLATSSPQISQFTHNCGCIKFVIKKDLSALAVVVITNIDGAVNIVNEGDALVKSYDSETEETILMWYPEREITCMSGCVIYQIAAYDTSDETKFIWYSKEGRLIVTDSIDTTDYSAALIGSYPNLLTQLISKSKALEVDIVNLLETKVDKEDGKGLSSNDYTDEQKNSLETLIETSNIHSESIAANADDISSQGDQIKNILSDMPLVDAEYDESSSNAQSGKAVAQAVASIVNSAPDTLDTLEELAKALGDDPNFATTIMTLLGEKADKEDLADEVMTVHSMIANEANTVHDHVINSSNPHSVTKEQIGLGNADNTSDMDKPISDAVQSELDNINDEIESVIKPLLDAKADKEDGMGLSSNDFTDEYKSMLENHEENIDLINSELEVNIYPSINALNDRVFQTPIATVPDTLEVNKEYNFGEVTELTLAFPTNANDGDVIYLTFKSGTTATTLTIDTTNTTDIEIIPEANCYYDIFAKYNGSVWLVNYSEYLVSEV